ncbi:epsin-2 isoform X4 [Scaptodrosophila lebanonensis]|uniref:Epsin-2 isoform X4 n=1 Tax=Drosophila lebanonensis TaxID=7225 RepID=A0A6J2TYX1_DROLE|nr:epsin-2 isoform X4 [Scaptodrosophila lebanonensis]
MRKQKDDMQVNVAGLRRNIKNLAHNYTDAQVKVREATSNDPWGPSATIMAEIADLTYNVVAFSEIMQMIWKRLNDHGKNWRHVYKALILLEYLIKTGTEKVAQQCKENIFAIQTLREFVYFEEGKDQGTHVREKAKQLVNLLKDDERLKNERVKALKAKERFAQHPSGFGSDGYIDGPSQRDMPPGWQEEAPKSVSELEMVRPQTAGEEELQLQLAMAMSREEAEQEEAKRRSDDVRLQLALSQSEQDFKDQNGRPIAAPRKEEPQSHLLDLLDISLGATSISSPPLGAAGGAAIVDPWATPASRAASQLSDPWSGTSSPQVDPWHPTVAPRTIMSAGVPMGAGAAGTNGSNDAWGVRTHSPSVASGSSTEGWLQTNGNANQNGGGARGEAWLTKTPAGAALAAAPVQQAAASNGSAADPWLAEQQPAAAAATGLADPWAPPTQAAATAAAASAGPDDPWKGLETGAVKKQSPDYDDFDLITNRNRSGELNNSHASNNNNASLLDDMDPLSTNYTGSVHPSTGATAKKPLKDPQLFLGENSALVNLDNLIKPITPQSQSGTAPAYNPFSDTVMPPKTNLFQQQQPAVPSINQLKQQAPFAVNMNQDPWAPVSTANIASQVYQSNSNNNQSSPQQQQELIYKPNHSNYHASIDSIRNMEIISETPQRPYFNSPMAPAGNNNNNNGHNNNSLSNYGTPIYSSYAQNYSSALSDSLAATPGITIAPMTHELLGTPYEANGVSHFGGNIGSYGFSEAALGAGAGTGAASACKLEQNNNMPWIKPEAAATNPFLS